MSEWTRKRLAEVATIEREVVTPDQIEPATLYVGLEHIESGGAIQQVAPVEKGDLSSSKFRFSRDHVLYGKLRPYLAKIALPNFNGICSTDILPILPTSGLDRRFLCYYLRQPRVVEMANAQATGANLPRISPRALGAFEIPLPPLAEQRRIADLLDRAEALRAQRRSSLAQLDTLTQAIFLDMFGDPVNNPMNWSLVQLSQVCSRVTVGIVVKPASYYVDHGVPALRSLNIRPGKIQRDQLVFFTQGDNDGRLSKTRLVAGDVVLVRSGQPGTSAVVPAELDGANAIDILITTPIKELVHADFLCAFFNSKGGRELVLSRQKGQIQKHLNVGDLSRAFIPLPPLNVQKQFANHLSRVHALIAESQRHLTELDALCASLQHRAFRGEL
jgi:type I restriction enzyme S subunit